MADVYKRPDIGGLKQLGFSNDLRAQLMRKRIVTLSQSRIYHGELGGLVGRTLDILNYLSIARRGSRRHLSRRERHRFDPKWQPRASRESCG